MRWTMVMRFVLLPWKPELVFTGTSIMGINPRFLCSLIVCYYVTKSQAFQKISRKDNYLAEHNLILPLITTVVWVKISSMCPSKFDFKFEYCSKMLRGIVHLISIRLFL
eukprot:TRINITY_DN15353_c0_g1_i3.p1 TRINITY_DN15353_c0_g1~~TRINITY_DN15353_c0_g1_i3.p1  ORF type:complete len:109 (-),score=3.44 TRINITY_DN15353_c0_g1_i3:181-507(-)